MNIVLLVAVAAVLVAVLVYFAQKELGERYRREDFLFQQQQRRSEAVGQAVHRYVDNSIRVSGITGALQAGVLSLPDSEAVAEFLDQCAASGETCLASMYRSELETSELLTFFQRCSAQRQSISNHGTIMAIIDEIKTNRNSA